MIVLASMQRKYPLLRCHRRPHVCLSSTTRRSLSTTTVMAAARHDNAAGDVRQAQTRQTFHDTCDIIYRSSTARAELCRTVREPSDEMALKYLAAFASDAGVWRDKHWVSDFTAATRPSQRVSLVLERVERWHRVRQVPRRVRMEEPWDWYPAARLMRRRFIFHYGPTNSGKTHAALQALTQARSGVYAAPLKALAGQVWRSVNNTIPCDLLIGDERRFGGAAEHVACTVEMTPTDLPVDVGVIDEIQMIEDRDRGWAWTRALLGLPAREIHLCGEERAIPIVENLLYKTFERNRIELVKHSRMVPLEPCEPLHGRLDGIRNGDCIVCFSRRAVLETRAKLEGCISHNHHHHHHQQQPKVHASFIYGAMPFEVREQQAATFNRGVEAYVAAASSKKATTSIDSDNACPQPHVLVSTDAIAYGLNMNIERIVFATMMKFDGKGMVTVPPAAVKQICGRAGRYGLVREHPVGYYTTLHADDFPALKKGVHADVPAVRRAGLLPTADILELFVEMMMMESQRGEGQPSSSQPPTFSEMMQAFTSTCASTSLFFPCDTSRSLLRIADILEAVPSLSLKDRILFCYLPLNDNSRDSMALLVDYAQQHAAGLPVQLQLDERLEKILGNTHQQQQQGAASRKRSEQLERLYRQAEMYCWLSWRFGKTFVYRDEGAAVKQRVIEALR